MPTLRDGVRLAGNIWGFARHHKAYWMVPVFVVLALVAVLLVVGQTVAPFIYTIFVELCRRTGDENRECDDERAPDIAAPTSTDPGR